MTCGLRFDERKRHYVCTEPDGRAHRSLHHDGEGHHWIGGHDQALTDDYGYEGYRLEYQMLWEDL